MRSMTVISVVPSPYQRDLFAAINALGEVQLRVFYLEASSPDSPWPEVPLEPYESVLPGTYLNFAGARIHFNPMPRELWKTDVLVLNTYTSLLAQRVLRLRKKDIPLVFWAERISGGAKGFAGLARVFMEKALNRCDGIVGIGSIATRSYEKLFPEKPVFNIPYYTNVSAFSDDALERTNPPPVTILFCGQMIERKGVDILLSAFQRVIAKGVKARLLLVGREADLPRMREKLNSQANALVDYAGFQAPDCLPRFFAQAHIFVLPSRYDGWGVVVNQAVAAGLPVVATEAVGASHDLLHPGVNGERIPADDVDALYQALVHLCVDSECRVRYAQASLEVAKDIVPSAGAQKWMNVIEALMSSK